MSLNRSAFSKLIQPMVADHEDCRKNWQHLVAMISSMGQIEIEVHLMLLNLASIPSRLIPLDGRAISRADNPKLFAAWGTTFGAGDGSTTFNVPYCQGLLFVGAKDGESIGDIVDLCCCEE